MIKNLEPVHLREKSYYEKIYDEYREKDLNRIEQYQYSDITKEDKEKGS